MAWNPQSYFPVGYAAAQMPQQMQMPMYQPQMAQQVQQTQPQMMTPPTIHAEIVQVDGEEAAAAYPVGAGASFVKTAGANGATLDVFVKRPPAPPAPAFDPTLYVTREEMEARLASLTAPRRAKKEEADG